MRDDAALARQLLLRSLFEFEGVAIYKFALVAEHDEG